MTARGARGWHKVASDYYDHRKFDRMTALGEVLWHRALAYAARNRTDGFVPRRALAALCNFEGLYLASGEAAGPDDALAEVLASGTFEPVDGGWMLHDYLDFQTSAEHQEHVSEARATAGAKGGKAKAARAAARSAEPALLDLPEEQGASKLLSKPLPEGRRKNPPSEGDAREARSTPKRATVIRADWAPDEALRLWAREHAPLVDVDHQAQQFLDYWLSKGEPRKDWSAGFRMWLGKAQVWAVERGGGRPGVEHQWQQPSPEEQRQKALAYLVDRLGYDQPTAEYLAPRIGTGDVPQDVLDEYHRRREAASRG